MPTEEGVVDGRPGLASAEPASATEPVAPEEPQSQAMDRSPDPMDGDPLWGDLVGFSPASQTPEAQSAEGQPSSPAAPAPASQTPREVQGAPPQAAQRPAGETPQGAAPQPQRVQVAPQEPQPAPAEPSQEPAEQTPEAQGQPQAPQPQQPAPQPQRPAEPAPAQQGQEPSTEEQMAKYVGQLAQSYVLDETATEAFTDEQAALIPNLAAQIHARAVNEALQLALQQVPQMVQAQVSQMREGAKAESEFYGRWPALRKPEFEQTVRTLGYGYRQLYPRASKEDFINHVGAQAMIALGLPLDGQQGGGGVPQAAVHEHTQQAPQGQVQPRELQRSFGPQAFQPAPAGGGTPPPQPQRPNGEDFWADLANDIVNTGWY